MNGSELAKVLTCLGAVLLCQISQNNLSAEEFESPPVLAASAVLPTQIVKGKFHQVDSRVENDGYMNIYLLHSRFGDQRVRGTYFLVQRISELDALDFLEKNYSTTKVTAGAVSDTAQGIVVAPIKGAQKVYETVSDTEKLGKTVRAVPGGIAGLFSMAADAAGSVATFTYEAGKEAINGKPEGPAKNEPSTVSKGVSYIEKSTLDFIGYNKAYRELAKTLQVDPATENELLRSELRRVSSIKATVKVSARFVPSLPSIPGVGTANRYLGYAEQTAMYDDPAKVEEVNEKMLSALGSGNKDLDHKRNAEFLANKFYSAAMRHELLESIEALKDVGNAYELLVSATNAKSREGAYFYVQAIRKLVDLHQKNNLFLKIIPDSVLPAAVTAKGLLIVPLPVDYLIWTSDVAKIFARFRQNVIQHSAKFQMRILIAGTLSPRCREELERVGVREWHLGTVF